MSQTTAAEVFQTRWRRTHTRVSRLRRGRRVRGCRFAPVNRINGGRSQTERILGQNSHGILTLKQNTGNEKAAASERVKGHDARDDDSWLFLAGLPGTTKKISMLLGVATIFATDNVHKYAFQTEGCCRSHQRDIPKHDVWDGRQNQPSLFLSPALVARHESPVHTVSLQRRPPPPAFHDSSISPPTPYRTVPRARIQKGGGGEFPVLYPRTNPAG